MTRPAPISVQPDWAICLPIQQQSVLLLAARGPDGVAKHHPVKEVVRAYRSCVLLAAAAHRTLGIGDQGDSFMDPNPMQADRWGGTMRSYLEHVDSVPHHYHLHLLHGAQILSYRHPSTYIRNCWSMFYFLGCKDMHLTPETRAEMDDRLNDFGRSCKGEQWCCGDNACGDGDHSLACNQVKWGVVA